jgi:Putative restriction endonuclease
MTRSRGRFSLRIQAPLALSDDTEPEPDVAVVPLGKYKAEHPHTARLVIEVSDTTLKDRAKPLSMHAQVPASTGLSTCAQTIEVYSSPEVTATRMSERWTQVSSDLPRSRTSYSRSPKSFRAPDQ